MTAPISPADLTLPSHIKLIRTRHGPLFVLATDDTVCRSLIQFGEWTFAEIALLSRMVQPGDHIVDVGANVGTHAISLARLVGPQGTVLAFEPQPQIFQLLAANILINGVNARPILGACAAERGLINVAGIDYSRHGNFGSISLAEMQADAADLALSPTPVPIFPLDDVFAGERLRLIKIDVEGMEEEVLRGAVGTIARHRPVLYIENQNPETSEALLRSVADFGYRAYWHVVPLYAPDNYSRCTDNPYGKAACINNLCVPAEMSFEPHDLPLVADAGEHPRRALAAHAAALNRKAADVLCSRARSLRKERRSAEALALCEKALRIDPRHLGALVQRGHALRDLGRATDALASYEQALVISPDDREAQWAIDKLRALAAPG